MDPAICQYYLHQTHSRKIPIPVFSRLLREFGSEAGVTALPKSRLEAMGFDTEQIDSLQAQASAETQQQVGQAMEWALRPGNHLVCYESVDYPQLLREIDSAPPLLFVRGSLETINSRQFAVVGSRKASIYGKRNAFWMSQELCKAGLCIGSGLASGIDTRAHEGALENAGATVAVIGTGIDRVYPRRNSALVDRIVERGALVSEFPLGTPPYPSNFPRRNRIISGMAEGTLVVEANLRSGSLITARLALEQNREVFAVPGSVGSAGSRGCHLLIKQGATLVEEPGDILEELGILNPRQTEVLPSEREATTATQSRAAHVLDAIDAQGCLFQAILDQCQLGIQELNSQLIQLEADGRIQQQGGRYFRLS